MPKILRNLRAGIGLPMRLFTMKLGGADNHPKSKGEKWTSQKLFRTLF